MIRASKAKDEYAFGGDTPSHVIELPVVYPGGGSQKYSLRVSMGHERTHFTPACVMEGVVNLGGVDHPLALVDADADGKYSDVGSLRFYVDNQFTGARISGYGTQPFTVDGKYYFLQEEGQILLFRA